MSKFTNIYNTFNQLINTEGTNNKIDFLKTTDTEFQSVLKWLFDSSKISGIAEKKWDKIEVELDPFFQPNNIGFDILSILNYIDDGHKTGTNDDIYNIKYATLLMCESDKDEMEMVKRIICKNLQVGCQEKNINSAIPGLIPTFDVMLANAMLKMEQKKIDKITNNGTREFAITEKCDGFRCVAIKEDGKVRLVSRQGKVYEGCVDIEKALKELPYDNFVLDSEIIISNRSSIPSKEQYKATSNIVTKKDCEKHGVTLNCFDYIDLDEWKSGKGTTPWTQRNIKLMEVLEDYDKDDSKPLYRIPLLYIGSDLDVAYNLLAKARSENKEGVMLRFTDSPYEFKRSDNLLKLKAMSELDAYITGYEEGTNKNVGRLGAFYCEIDHPQFGKLKFKVGGGYDDEERKSYWKNRDALIGRVMEVQYFEVTQNSTTKEYSVRFPVHKCIKDEGTVPNN